MVSDAATQVANEQKHKGKANKQMTTMAMCVQVGMEDLKRLMVNFGPEISICIRGRHAVGKSEGTYQAAALMRDDFYKDATNVARYKWTYDEGLPVIERRLSQLTEGDLTGMPDMDSGRKSTVFKPCDWLIDACERPVVLFLDERNRALEGVKQAVFQLMDSRAFYGHKLHPGTRVVVAENVGDLYNVQQCDPAEVSRAATVELRPSVDEWLKYAAQPGKCHDLTVSFIRANKDYLEFDPSAPENAKKAFEPNKKYPDRRAWFKLDQQLQRNKLIENPDDPLFYVMAASMVGMEAALKFTDFAKTFEHQVSVRDVLADWDGAKRKLGNYAKSTAKYLELAKKLENWFKTNTLTRDQASQVGKFMHDCPAEPRMVTWAALQTNKQNLFRVHPHVDALMVRTATGEDNTQPEAPTVPAPKAKTQTATK